MAGQSANESRKEVAKRLNNLDCSKQKKTATGGSPHGHDHYPGKKEKVGK
jgi:hypothetical protein